MVKRLVSLYFLLVFVFLLTGCLDTLIYKDEVRPVGEVEDMIEDELEQVNPNTDVEVDIQEGAK